MAKKHQKSHKISCISVCAFITLAPQTLTKKLAHVGVLLGHFISQNRVPKLSDPGPPLRLCKCSLYW